MTKIVVLKERHEICSDRAKLKQEKQNGMRYNFEVESSMSGVYRSL